MWYPLSVVALRAFTEQASQTWPTFSGIQQSKVGWELISGRELWNWKILFIRMIQKEKKKKTQQQTAVWDRSRCALSWCYIEPNFLFSSIKGSYGNRVFFFFLFISSTPAILHFHSMCNQKAHKSLLRRYYRSIWDLVPWRISLVWFK